MAGGRDVMGTPRLNVSYSKEAASCQNDGSRIGRSD